MPTTTQQQWLDLVKAYLKASSILQKAYTLNPEAKTTRKLLGKIQYELGLLSLQQQDFIISRFYLTSSLDLGYTKSKQALNLLNESQHAAQTYRQKKLQEIMEAIVDGGKERMFEEYVTEVVRMKHPDVTTELVKYLESDSRWQRKFTIEVLGKLGDRTTVYKNKNIKTWFIELLQKKQEGADFDEAQELIWALGRMRVYSSKDLITKVRTRYGSSHPLWQNTQIPYSWLSK